MALFKILRGKSSNLTQDNEKAFKKDGYAWFTTDDGYFYIDSARDEDNQIIDRILINPRPKVIDISIKASDWINGEYIIQDETISVNAEGFISFNNESFEIASAIAKANFQYSYNNSAHIIKCLGDIPQCDISLKITILPKDKIIK